MSEPKVLHAFGDWRVIERWDFVDLQYRNERLTGRWHSAPDGIELGTEIASLASRLAAAEAERDSLTTINGRLIAERDDARLKHETAQATSMLHVERLLAAERREEEMRKALEECADELEEALSWVTIPRTESGEIHLRDSRAILARVRALANREAGS